jgi:putative NADPH-quinone reductase
MNILLILAHPSPGSLNHALAKAVREALEGDGHGVVFHDLCAEGFDPCLPGPEIATGGPVPERIAAHCRELREADGIVIVHPNWWGMPPAILAGWVDRVVRPGVAYRFEEGDGGEGVPVGLLKAKHVLVLNTSNTPDEREQRVFGDPLELIWKQCVFDLCGVRSVKRRMFNVVVTSTLEQRRQWLAEAAGLARELFPATAGARNDGTMD